VGGYRIDVDRLDEKDSTIPGAGTPGFSLGRCGAEDRPLPETAGREPEDPWSAGR